MFGVGLQDSRGNGNFVANVADMTAQQALFCEEYIKDLNITQAAIRAGYTPKYADALAYKLLGNIGIQERITTLQAAAAKRNEITVDRIIAEYATIAFLDPSRIFDDDGNCLPLEQIDKASRRAIARIITQEIGSGDNKVGEIKQAITYDKIKALDSLCRVLGFNAPIKQEHAGKDGQPLPASVSVTILTSTPPITSEDDIAD